MVDALFEAALITGVVQLSNIPVTLVPNVTYYSLNGSAYGYCGRFNLEGLRRDGSYRYGHHTLFVVLGLGPAMHRLSIALVVLLSLSLIRTVSAQTPVPTINGTPPPFTFTGSVVQTGQNFKFGDATSFGGIPFTNIPPPNISDVICYDGVAYTPRPPSAGSATILYVTSTASDIGGYDVLGTAPVGGQFTVTNTIPATTVKTLIEAFATVAGYPNVTVISAGEWQADAYAQVSSALNTTTLNIDVYQRTSGGVETLLFSFPNSTISGNGTGIQHISVESVQPAFAIATTDRIVAKYSMTKTGGASITGTVYGGGSSAYSHIHTPLGVGTNLNATQVNGASIPTSKALVGTNSSGQFIDATVNPITNSAAGGLSSGTGPALNITGAPIATGAGTTLTMNTSYLFVWAATSTIPTVYSFNGNSTNVGFITMLNSLTGTSPYGYGTAANALSAGALPATLGTLTAVISAGTSGIPVVIWAY
jgi:hypothetical protein